MISKDLALKIFEGFSIQRWTDFIRPIDFVEMDNAAERMVVAYLLGKIEEKKGNYVDWNWLIYASFFDLLRKISLCDIKAPVQNLLKSKYPEGYLRLNEWVLSQYKDKLQDDDLFRMFTIYFGQKSNQFEIPEESKLASKIFSAAHKFATMRELQMLSVVNEPVRLEKITRDLEANLQPYLDLTGLQMLMTHQKLFDLLLKIEQLRFQVRWNQTPRIPETTVLGHCFFVAILTLLLSRSNPVKMCDKRIQNNFFSALFHDLPEAVTRDIISPVKSATVELPSIVKKIEDEIVSEELLPLMDESFSEELIYFTSNEFSNRIQIDSKTKEVTWLELNKKYNNEKYSPIDGRTVRIADHLSALLEAHISIKHGITSVHLETGKKGVLENYASQKPINGFDVFKIFSEIVG